MSPRQAGFTLIEMLVSLLVLGLVLTALSSVIFTGMRLADSQERITTRMAARSEIQGFVAARLAEMEMVAAPGFPRRVFFEITEEEIQFVSSFPAHSAFPGRRHVTLAFEDGALMVTLRNWRDRGAGELIDRAPLILGATGIRFSGISATGTPNALPFALPFALGADITFADGPAERYLWPLGPRLAAHCVLPAPRDGTGLVACDGRDR